MVHANLDPHHDEVNLHRLLRRLEKSSQTPEDWEVYEDTPAERSVSGGSSKAQVRLKAQKGIQMVKYARKLMQNLEIYASDTDSLDSFGMPGRAASPGAARRVQEFTDMKIRLDRVDTFLKDQVQRYTEPRKRPPSVLARLPVPVLPKPEEAGPQSQEGDTAAAEVARRPSAIPDPIVGPTDNLLLSPPELDGIPTAGLDFDYPPLYSPATSPFSPPARPQAGAASSALPSSSTTATSRKPRSEVTQSAAHASLHEELSSQLESMAAQLKRNAIHFSSNLAKDKSVVEEAAEKLERNYDVMQMEKGRLGRLNKISGGTTWMTLGIVLAVLVLFIAMIGVIRFSRI